MERSEKNWKGIEQNCKKHGKMERIEKNWTEL